MSKSFKTDEQRVVEKIGELTAALARLNERYTRSAQLRAESSALSDRFDLPKQPLPNVVPPARRDFVTALATLPRDLLDHASQRTAVEECEHRLRERRTYKEVAGTEGFQIITAAGLKPFPELSERQQVIVGERKSEQENMRRQFAGLPTIPSRGSTPIGGSV